MAAVLITGATSFLGQALGTRLAGDGPDVHVLVRPTSDRARFGTWPRRPVFHVVDDTYDSVADAVVAASPDVVYHLATHYVREHQPQDITAMLDANVRLGTHLLEAMTAVGRRRFVHSVSFFQYGNGDGYRPLNLYAATKQAFDDVVHYYVEAGLVDSACAVFYEVYGVGDWRKKIVPALLAAQREDRVIDLAEPGQVLNLVYVDDAIEALLRVARLFDDDATTVTGARYAVRSPETVTLSTLVGLFEAVNGRRIRANWNAYPTPERSIARPWAGPLVPGWLPRIDLSEGIARLNRDGV